MEEKNTTKSAPKQAKTTKVNLPSVKDMFAAGVQFGHETRRWNPKMEKYIYDSRQNIHIIDLTKTEELLKEAVDFLVQASSEGPVLLVGTKKQAAQIIKDSAVTVGAHFVNMRWAGGLLTNFKKIKESYRRLRELETGFEKGVEGRTKYEISLMKKEWAKLNRLYGGVKTLDRMPTAIIVIDSNYEKGAIREAKQMKIPVVSIVDTNCDPEAVEYPIPGNDDAISSIKLILNTLCDAIQAGNKGQGVKHLLKDYTKAEVKIIKTRESDSEEHENLTEGMDTQTLQKKRVFKKVIKKKPSTKGGSKGILERVQDSKGK